MQRVFLRILFGLGLVLFPFAFKRAKLKDWLLIFFLKGYLSSLIDQVVVNMNQISYPIRLKPKYFKISILFDYLLFPLLCVFYNRTSAKSNIISIIIQPFVYSLPMTIFEVIIEKYTRLVKYKNKWNWMITYLTLVSTFLFVRGFMAVVRKVNIEEE
jgi:hypothetical protein